MSVLTCKNVSVSYDNKKAVQNLSFSIEKGDFLCIIGENGSGKTTLMKAILKLLPLAEGEIKLEGSSRIGYLPQQTVVQKDFPASVQEVVLSGCLNDKTFKLFFNKADKARAKEQMERLNIYDIRKSSYRDLSGGQQQRVLLARALCAAEGMLMLDEPVAALDPIVTAEFYELLKKLNKELGFTIVMVSHDITGVMSNATKILHMQEKALFFGTTKEYAKSDICMRMTGGAENA